jgi:hypothetical protein
MPQPYPKEFRDDVIRVVQTRDSWIAPGVVEGLIQPRG